MGSFKQHWDWAQYILTIILVLFIYFLLNITDAQKIEYFGDASGGTVFGGIVAACFIYLIASGAPDVDLPTSDIGKKMKIFMPIIMGVGTAIAMYRAVEKFPIFTAFFTSLSPGMKELIICLIAGSIGFVITFLILWLPIWEMFAKKAFGGHWGYTHSLVGTLLFFGLVWTFFTLTWSTIWGTVMGLAFALGYMTHLICDQFYHDLRDKEWAGHNRYAIKLFSNYWDHWDPLILFICKPLNIAGEVLHGLDDGKKKPKERKSETKRDEPRKEETPKSESKKESTSSGETKKPTVKKASTTKKT